MNARILVCDDESHITRAVEMKLTRAGFKVETVGDGLEAYQRIQAAMPDLLISDCQMPRLGGIELCRRLRQDPRTENLPVILLTAKGFEFDHAQIMAEYWISAVTLKPFSPRELLKTVENVLHGRPSVDSAVPQSSIQNIEPNTT